MRTMLKLSVPVERGNAAIQDGSLTATLQALMDDLQPEAAYFYAEDGRRAAMMVFDMKDPDQIPQIAEPLFQNLNATVEIQPVMNGDDLRRALDNIGGGA